MAPDLQRLLAKDAVTDEFWAPVAGPILEAADELPKYSRLHCAKLVGVRNTFIDMVAERSAERAQRMRDDAEAEVVAHRADATVGKHGGADNSDAGNETQDAALAAAARADAALNARRSSGLTVADVAGDLVPKVLARYRETATRFLADPGGTNAAEAWRLLNGASLSQAVNEELDMMAKVSGTTVPDGDDSLVVHLINHLCVYRDLVSRAQGLLQVAQVFRVEGGSTLENAHSFISRFGAHAPQDGADDGCNVPRSLQGTPLSELQRLSEPVLRACKSLKLLNNRAWGMYAPRIVDARELITFLGAHSPAEMEALSEGLENENGEVEIAVTTANAAITVQRHLRPLFEAARDHSNDGNAFFEVCVRTFRGLNRNFLKVLELSRQHTSALQYALDSIQNRSEQSKEKIFYALANGIFSFRVHDGNHANRDADAEDKPDRAQASSGLREVVTTLEYTGYKGRKAKLENTSVWELKARALFAGTHVSTRKDGGEAEAKGGEGDGHRDADGNLRVTLTSDMIDKFVTVLDSAEKVATTLNKLCMHGHLGYRK